MKIILKYTNRERSSKVRILVKNKYYIKKRKSIIRKKCITKVFEFHVACLFVFQKKIINMDKNGHKRI